MSTNPKLLPERTPEIGQLVRVRSRKWLVEDVVNPHGGGSVQVSLACADDDAQGQTLTVFWDYEPDREIPNDAGWDYLANGRFDSPRHFAAFFNTLCWNCTTATQPDLFQAPFRAGIHLDAYQMEPLRKALLLPRVNLFIADDTGLGKTIEAGLIARELLLRRKVKRIVQEETRQLQADMRHWQRRLAQFDRDLEQEPGRIEAFYKVRAQRVEPVGLVYLWPETN